MIAKICLVLIRMALKRDVDHSCLVPLPSIEKRIFGLITSVLFNASVALLEFKF